MAFERGEHKHAFQTGRPFSVSTIYKCYTSCFFTTLEYAMLALLIQPSRNIFVIKSRYQQFERIFSGNKMKLVTLFDQDNADLTMIIEETENLEGFKTKNH